MLINKIHIDNYKSLVNTTIINPSAFSVFFGTNSAGKSNLFEALELLSFVIRKPNEALKFFGNFQELYTVQKLAEKEKKINIKIEIPNGFFNFDVLENQDQIKPNLSESKGVINKFFGDSFSRIFLGNEKNNKEIFKDDKKLTADGSNIVKVLGRLLKDPNTRDELVEWLQYIIPEFRSLEVKQNELTGEDFLIVFEENSSIPFTGNLISDGTKNSISLITSLYQSNEPQFLLIEEPENGLNPKVIKEFVQTCREFVEEKGHTIWLATHSQTLVSEIKPEEAILVYKENGFSRIKQFQDVNLYDLKMDEAWLSNVLGGGIPW